MVGCHLAADDGGKMAENVRLGVRPDQTDDINQSVRPGLIIRFTVGFGNLRCNYRL